MYSVLKSKRCHFEIPQNPYQNEDDLNIIESRGFLQNQYKIVSSCFLDDVFILFLFNSGRYIIVNSSGPNDQPSQNNKASTKKNKKSKTVESQIVYYGNILKELQKRNDNEGFEFKKSNYSSQKLLSKSSLKLIEESYSKMIFTDCKRIRTNECIIVTRYSRNVYWLKVFKQALLGHNESSISIKTSILELPITVLSQILSVDKIQLTQNMMIITDLIEFDNNSSSNSHQLKGQSHLQRGSFCIKNEIVEDKMIYFTCYTRIPQHIREKYSQTIKQVRKQFQSFKSADKTFPSFIITKLEFPIPINEVSSNFIIQVSDKSSNQIAIYKQSEDDDNEWEIKLYRFGFQHIKGEQNVKMFTRQMTRNNQGYFYSEENFIGIENKIGLLKPIIITLPQQFTSSIHLQQFLRIDKHQQNSTNQPQYIIISVNQTFVENPHNQPNVMNDVRTVRVNGQLFFLDENGNLRQPQNNTNNNNCWVHSCRLTYHENSQSYSQQIQRLHNFHIDSLSFLKVININYQLGLMYVLRLAHQSVDRQLYENKIDLINIKNGQVVEKGYCSLKNYSFSPNQKYILDTPDIFSQESDYFYHIRIMFDKKSLYLFMIENANQYFQKFKDINFIETVLNLL